MKKVLSIFVLAMFAVAASAQRDLMLSQQFFSRLNANPAATGNSDDIDLFLLGHWQWVGVEDSPKSGVLNASDYFEPIRSGVGLTMTYDDLGVANRTFICKAAYAYHVNLNESLLLSMGLSAGMLYHYWDPEGHRLLDPEEMGTETFPSELQTTFKPDVDLGFELAMPKLLLGASVTHLLNNEDMVSTSVPGRHLYFYARPLFNLSDRLALAPAIVYMHRNKVDKVELNVMAFYNRMIWGGVTYRPDVNAGFSSNALNFTLGIEWNTFRVGYSFEWGTGDISSLSSNAHELLLSLRIPKKTEKYVRFMED